NCARRTRIGISDRQAAVRSAAAERAVEIYPVRSVQLYQSRTRTARNRPRSADGVNMDREITAGGLFRRRVQWCTSFTKGRGQIAADLKIDIAGQNCLAVRYRREETARTRQRVVIATRRAD